MEEKLLINGGRPLEGKVKVDASKNAYLPILAASTLCDGEINLKNFCPLSDLFSMRDILRELNIKSHISGDEIYIDTRLIQNNPIGFALTKRLRASIFLLGPLLSRFGYAKIAKPGGCNIGLRPIDQYVKGFKTLGAEVEENDEFYICKAKKLHSGEINLDFPSVGATESLMMCATLIEGRTKIKNSAKEPEIVDLQNFLNQMGAKVFGAGTDEILVDGVKRLHGTEYSVMPDRIIAGTYILACAIAHGDILVENAKFEHNEMLFKLLSQTACQIKNFDYKIRVISKERLSSIKNICTKPYPGFPTDLQPQMMALQAVSKGQSQIVENIFENRLSHTEEFLKMGANISVCGNVATITGVETLTGTEVCAPDLRAGAGLILAGLAADGQTTLRGLNFVDRGYYKIEEKLSMLGADIKRIKIEQKVDNCH